MTQFQVDEARAHARDTGEHAEPFSRSARATVLEAPHPVPAARIAPAPAPAPAARAAGRATDPAGLARVAAPAPALSLSPAALPAVPLRHTLEAFHGPQGPARRSLASAAAMLVAVLVVGAVAAAIVRPAPVELGALALALGVFALITLIVGAVRPDARGLPTTRGPLLAGAVVVIALAAASVFGTRIPGVRHLLEIVAIATLVGVLVNTVILRVFRPRTVLISPVGGAGVLGAPRADATIALSDPALADPAALVRAVLDAADAVGADLVHVAGPLSDEVIAELSWGLRTRRIPIQMDLFDGTVCSRRVHASMGVGSASITVEPPARPWTIRASKRAMDILGSGALLLLASPLLIVTAIAVKATDGGPIIYRQERVGRDGRPFGIYKFRTMAVDADARLADLLREQQTEGKPLFKVQNDPRLTRIGGFLRRYSIDELPQLLNVLTGDMSLVGPRPQRDAEVALYTGTASHRLGVRPGMTGIWQVSGRSNLSWEEARRLDVHYAHNWSLSMDIAILLRTFRAVVGKDGAY